MKNEQLLKEIDDKLSKLAKFNKYNSTVNFGTMIFSNLAIFLLVFEIWIMKVTGTYNPIIFLIAVEAYFGSCLFPLIFSIARKWGKIRGDT